MFHACIGLQMWILDNFPLKILGDRCSETKANAALFSKHQTFFKSK